MKKITITFLLSFTGIYAASAQSSVPDPIQVQNPSSSNLCPSCLSGNSANEMIQDDNTGNIGIV